MNYDDKPWLKYYDEWVEPEMSFPDITLADMMEEIYTEFPDRPAYHFLGITHTYEELDYYSRKFANYLTDIGCRVGDVVAISIPNIPQFLIAFMGTIRAGCVVSGTSLLLTPKELKYQINDSDAKVLITLDFLFEANFLQIKDQVPNLKHVVGANIADFLPAAKRFLGKLLKKIPSGKMVPVEGKEIVSFMDLLRKYPDHKQDIAIKPGDNAMLYYTGGTTGPPKGAEISHYNVVSNCITVGKWCNLERGKEVFLSTPPFFHVAGTAICLYAMTTGSSYILIPDPRNTELVCKEMATYSPTVVANVPSLYIMLLDDPKFKKLDHSKSKLYFSGSAPFADETFKALESVIGEGKLAEAYGMTESFSVITMSPIGRAKIGSAGTPLSNVHIKLVDLDNGTKEVPFGEEGEIIVRTPSLMKGYYKKPDETANAIREFKGEKWMFTGDVGKMDDDGYLYMVDRCKDMIIVSGFKVFSKEVEAKLYEHPAVEFCAFIGMPNPERPGSELVKAVIQLTSEYKERNRKEVEEDILSYCKENMAPYKVPKIIEFMEEMPLTAVGKVDKKALR